MKKVILDRTKLLKGLGDFDFDDEVYFPELTGLFGANKNEVPFLKIKAASLDDQIRAKDMIERARITAVSMLQDFGKKEILEKLNLEDESKKASALHEKTQLEVSLFHRCVVQPMFSLEEVVWLAERLPEVVNRVAKTALFLASMERLNGDSERSQSNNLGS